jgi:hypothetical protein
MAMTAALLMGLLREDERYRRTWRARMDRTPTGEVQQSAVARVIAEHLWETGQAEDQDDALPRRLKDTVARALSGRHLSPRTLRLFTDAFEMRPVHRTLLWAYLEREAGRDDAAAQRRRVRAPGDAPDDGPQAWESVSLHAVHAVDVRGRVRHRVAHVVRALQPVAAISLGLSPASATVAARQGAVVGPEVDRPGPGGLVLQLLTPLAAGETAVLEYDVVPAGDPVVTQARTLLFAPSPAGTVVVQIRFDPARLPREVWWWEDTGHDQDGDGPPAPTPMALGPDCSAHRVLTGGRTGTVGFSWSW